MAINLKCITVGALETNCYLLEDKDCGRGLLVDPGDEAGLIREWMGDVTVERILVTHGHEDHIGAVETLRRALECPVGGHTADAELSDLDFEFELHDGLVIPFGSATLKVYEVPGHTPGSLVFAVHDRSFEHALVGDAIFPGGPGHTQSHEDLERLLAALEHTVFTWPDEVVLLPGHGAPTSVGTERAAFERLRSQELPDEMFGDVTW